jgi:protease IV
MTELQNPAPAFPSPPPLPPAPRKRSLWWLWVLIGVGGFFLLIILPLIFLGTLFGGWRNSSLGETGAGVAIIRVDGPIASGRSEGVFGSDATASETVIDHINQALEDRDAKAILVRINSPGGSPAASDEIYQQLMQARDNKPVVVSMGDVAASGGYYIASAGDEIYADAATITGSIGVITTHLDLSNLFKKVGVDYGAITTGEFKDMGNFARPMTSREKQLIKGLLDDIYQQFVDAVAEGRHMPREKILKIADGRVFTGRQAKALGLVDNLGGFEAALGRAGKLGGLKHRPRMIEYGPHSVFEAFLGGADSSSQLHLLAREMLLNASAKELSHSLLR